MAAEEGARMRGAAAASATTAPAAEPPKSAEAKPKPGDKSSEFARDGRRKKSVCGNLARMLFILGGLSVSLYIVLDSWAKKGEYFPKPFGESTCVARVRDTRAVCQPRIMEGLVSQGEADWIIEEAEKSAKRKGGWKDQRHDFMRTKDLKLFEIGKPVKEFFNEHVLPKLEDEVGSNCMVDPQDIYALNIYIMKFEFENVEGIPSGTRPHHDDSSWSFVMSLSEPTKDFRAGGTWFSHPAIGIQKPPKGGAITFGGALEHRAEKLMDGTRYVMTGEWDLKACRFDERQRAFGAVMGLLIMLLATWWYIPDYDVVQTKRHGVQFIKKVQ